MKKLTALALAIALIFTFCACSAQVDDGNITVAIVQPLSHTSLNQIRDTIKGELENSGLDIIVQTADANNDSSAFTTIVSNYKAQGADVIVPIATPIATAAKTVFEGTNTPIVFAAVTYPVAAGLTGEGCENITGVSDYIPPEETVNLILSVQPDCDKIGLLYTSSETNSVAAMNEIKAYCDTIGLAYEEATISDPSDLQSAAQSLISKGIDAFYTNTDNTIASAMPIYTDIAYGANIPVYCAADSMVADGGFATTGVNYVQIGKQVAQMVIDIIGGKSPSDIPYETVKDCTRFINLQSAARIGMDIPAATLDTFTVLVEADGTNHFGE